MGPPCKNADNQLILILTPLIPTKWHFKSEFRSWNSNHFEHFSRCRLHLNFDFNLLKLTTIFKQEKRLCQTFFRIFEFEWIQKLLDLGGPFRHNLKLRHFSREKKGGAQGSHECKICPLDFSLCTFENDRWLYFWHPLGLRKECGSGGAVYGRVVIFCSLSLYYRVMVGHPWFSNIYNFYFTLQNCRSRRPHKYFRP